MMSDCTITFDCITVKLYHGHLMQMRLLRKFVVEKQILKRKNISNGHEES